MNTRLWDRTRWDRLQAVLLIGAITLTSSLPLWVFVLAATARVEVHP